MDIKTLVATKTFITFKTLTEIWIMLPLQVLASKSVLAATTGEIVRTSERTSNLVNSRTFLRKTVQSDPARVFHRHRRTDNGNSVPAAV